MRQITLAAMVIAASGALSCKSDAPPDVDAGIDAGIDAGRPAGWTEESHGSKATPNYGLVFPSGKVNRLEITITAADWQRMLDDMTKKYGEFGKGGGMIPGPRDGGGSPGDGGGVPPEAITACKGKASGDTCEINIMIVKLAGTCMSLSGGLACVPDAAVTACKGKKAGDTCSMSVPGAPMPIPGTCQAQGPVVTCATQMPGKPPQGDGGPGGPGMPPKGDGGGGNMSFGEKPIYVPCSMTFEGKTWWHLGVRFKGNSTLQTSWSGGTYKISLRLDMDEFEDDHPEIKNQRFYGFKELSLASNAMDSSYLREKVTADLFRAGGVPAPRTAFYRVYIDHGKGPLYFGLYTLIEVPDKPLFKAQFQKSGGNLYKPEGTGASWVKFDQASFAKKTNEDDKDWSDVKAAVDALHASSSDPSAWRAALEQHFDAEGFMRWLAVNTVMVNWDTYGAMTHNYYLYGDPGDGGVLHWIPWDNNMALSTSMAQRSPLTSFDMSKVGPSWPLISKLYADPVYRQTYLAALRAFVSQVFTVDAIHKELKAAHTLIKPYVVGQEGEQAGYSHLTAGKESAEFNGALQALLTHVTDRNKAAWTYLDPKPADAGPMDAGTD